MMWRDKAGGLFIGLGFPAMITEVLATHTSYLKLAISLTAIIAGGLFWAEADDIRIEQDQITIAIEPSDDGGEVMTVRDKNGRLVCGAAIDPDPLGGTIVVPEVGRMIQQAHLTGRRAAG